MIALSELIDTLEIVSSNIDAYLDKTTGKVIVVTEDEKQAAKDGSLEELFDDQEEMDVLIKCIEDQKNERFIKLPSSLDIHEWQIMERFSLALNDKKVSEYFIQSLHGRGAFKNFKECLRRYDLEKQWHKYRQDALSEIAIEWCKQHGIKYSS